MKKDKRQQRIQQKHSNLTKWQKRCVENGWQNMPDKNIKIMASHGKVCSCFMCMNPRRNQMLKNKERLTLKEKKFTIESMGD